MTLKLTETEAERLMKNKIPINTKDVSLSIDNETGIYTLEGYTYSIELAMDFSRLWDFKAHPKRLQIIDYKDLNLKWYPYRTKEKPHEIGVIRPGTFLKYKDGEIVLVGDVNIQIGCCDCCKLTREIPIAYARMPGIWARRKSTDDKK